MDLPRPPREPAVAIKQRHGLSDIGSIAAYATAHSRPSLPFWELLFRNARLLLLGSDDVPAESKREATAAVNGLLEGGWRGVEIACSSTLDDIVVAHECAESKRGPGRVVVTL